MADSPHELANELEQQHHRDYDTVDDRNAARALLERFAVGADTQLTDEQEVLAAKVLALANYFDYLEIGLDLNTMIMAWQLVEACRLESSDVCLEQIVLAGLEKLKEGQ